MDGSPVLDWILTGTWTRYAVPLAAGMHEIEFRYQKNVFGSAGADAAWIDDVVFTP